MTNLYQHASAPDLERAVLAVLYDGRTKDAVSILQEACPTPEAFHEPRHQLIARAIWQMATDGRKVDGITLRDALGQIRFADVVLDKSGRAWSFQQGLDPSDSLLMHIGDELLSQIAETVALSSGLKANCERLAAYHRQRELIRTLDGHLQAATGTDGRTKTEAIGDKVIDDVSQALGGSTHTLNMDEAMGSALKLHDAAKLRGPACLADWGLEGMNRLVPLRGGRMYVLAANTGCGKSSLSLQAAVATSKRLGPGAVAIINLEQPPEEIASILLAREIGTSTKAIDSGYLTRAQRDAGDEIRARWEGLELPIRAQDSCTIGDAISWIRQRYLRSRGKLALVVVDYLQLVDPTNERDGDYITITRASRRLKRLALELRIAVLVMSSIGREGRKSNRGRNGEIGPEPEPRKEDLKGSGSIESDADVVALIWSRAEVKGPQLRVEIKVDKNRGGPEDVVHAIFDKPNGQQFKDVVFSASTMAAPTPVAPEDSSRIHHNHPPEETEDKWVDSAAAKAFP